MAFEGMIITSDREFFVKNGYVKGQSLPPNLANFFDDCYRFALREIGYRGTDANIISAVVHLDETTPHLQLYYIPVVNKGKKKVYAKDKDGKVLRNSKGSPIQTKDFNGKGICEYVKLDKPKICSSDFWEERGAQLSYGSLQDDFHDMVGCRYGLDRGEVGSNKKHTTKYQWEMQELEKKRQTLQEELQGYRQVFDDAMSGKKPFFKSGLEKQITGLILAYRQLEKEHQISIKDNDDLFNQLQKLQKQFPELEQYKDYVKFINEYAPDALKQARKVAEQRQTEKLRPKTKTGGNFKY